MNNNKFNLKFKNMPIKKKLVISHGSIIVTTFILIVVLLLSMKSIEGNLVKMFEGPTSNIWYSSDLYYTQIDIQRAVNRMMAEGIDRMDEMYPQLEKTVDKNLKIIDNAYAKLQNNLLTENDKSSLKQIKEMLDSEISTHRIETIRLLKEGNFDAAREYNNTYYKPSVDKVKEEIDKLESSIYATAKDYCNTSKQIAMSTIIIGIVMLIIVMVTSITIAGKVTYMIEVPVKEITNASRAMYSGDMSASSLITYESEDELGILADSMRGTMNNLDDYIKEISQTLVEIAEGDFTRNFEDITDFLGDFAPIKSSMHQIQNQLNKVLSNIKNISIGVASGAEQVSSGAQILSKGTAEQAMSIEELKCIIDDILEQINNNSQSAHKAQEAVEIAGLKLLDSNEQMKELTKAISQISDSSEEIRKIIQTIEGISLQTNMLALNASIEAARAGEAGKGFAVVANEVRELANRSSEASKGTTSLIENSLSSVNNGIKIAKETADSLLLVVDKAQQVTAQVDQIVDASKEQSLSVANITKEMQEISSVVQTNSTTAEESASASEDLSSQANVLKNLVESFTLKDIN